MRLAVLAVVLVTTFAAAANATTLTVPFDYSRQAIGLDVTVRGTPLYMILDTGVDPSGIDLKRAEALGLSVQRDAGGEASGEGDAKSVQIFPAAIDALVLGGQPFGTLDAVAMDMSALSAHYGRQLDGVLGYSFLSSRIVLLDYPQRALSILSETADAVPLVRACRTHFSIPLRSYGGDTIPVIPDFHFGDVSAPVTLDTGSTRAIAFFQGALDLPALRAKVSEKGETTLTGARGTTTAKAYVLNAGIGFGPFALPQGQIATELKAPGSAGTRLANIGNPIFAAMKLKMLLDYRARQITFYGNCSNPRPSSGRR